MSRVDQRRPGSFTRVDAIDGKTYRRCRDCDRELEQSITFFQRQNKALSKKSGSVPREVWDCRCRPCSRTWKAEHRAKPHPPRHYAERIPLSKPPKVPAAPPAIDGMGFLLRQIMGSDD
jgi:hypothetical protein